MRKFSVPVDMRSRREMESFLRDHFRYPTMNSWNQATSYACNLKVHSLGLASEITSKLYDMLDTQEYLISGMICWQNSIAPTATAGRLVSMAEAVDTWSSIKGSCVLPGICPTVPIAVSGTIAVQPIPVMSAVPAEGLREWITVHRRNNPLHFPDGARIWMKTMMNGPFLNSGAG